MFKISLRYKFVFCLFCTCAAMYYVVWHSFLQIYIASSILMAVPNMYITAYLAIMSAELANKWNQNLT